jgi:hypothetical protein
MASEHVSKKFPRANYLLLISGKTLPDKYPPLPPFTLTTRDGAILSSVDEVTAHFLTADRLSDQALMRILQNLTKAEQ